MGIASLRGCVFRTLKHGDDDFDNLEVRAFLRSRQPPDSRHPQRRPRRLCWADTVEKLLFRGWLRKFSLVDERYKNRAGGTAVSLKSLYITLCAKLTAITDPISEQIGFCQENRAFEISSLSTVSAQSGRLVQLRRGQLDFDNADFAKSLFGKDRSTV
jgi:hypothetical protein